MKLNNPENSAPDDSDARKAIAPVICYPAGTLPDAGLGLLKNARATNKRVAGITVPPRDARCIEVPAGHFLRITSVEGSQVGDLNLWNSNDLTEKFYAGKTRALHGTHLSTGDRMWSSFPTLRPLATVVHDTLDWYGFDEYGASVHDVIGTRCDPYTNNLLSGGDHYHYCCHSNLSRALAESRGLALPAVEQLVHDVLNVFMCTGFSRETGQYIMKASPVRPGDYVELFAEIDLLAGLSACPGGDCSSEHSSDKANCYPLQMDVFKPADESLAEWVSPGVNGYDRSHGLSTS